MQSKICPWFQSGKILTEIQRYCGPLLCVSLGYDERSGGGKPLSGKSFKVVDLTPTSTAVRKVRKLFASEMQMIHSATPRHLIRSLPVGSTTRTDVFIDMQCYYRCA